MNGIPTIGSMWRTTNGRLVRVDEWVIPKEEAARPWARCTVLNPRDGQRSSTSFSEPAFDTVLTPVVDGVPTDD